MAAPVLEASTPCTPTAGTSSLTFAHTCTGADRLLFVTGGAGDGSANEVITGITYNGAALSKATYGWAVSDGNFMRNEGWWKIAPDAGSAFNVVVTYTGSVNQAVAGASSFTGVHQTVPAGTPVTANGTSTTPAVNAIGSAVDELVLASISSDSTTLAQGGTLSWELEGAFAGDTSWGAQTITGAASVNATWTTESELYAAGGVSLKPVGAAANRWIFGPH